MRSSLLLLFVTSTVLHAQEKQPSGPVTASQINGQLKPEQVNSVLKQLDELERTILAQRGSTLSGAIQRIRTAAGSDAAALNFIAECDQIVNVDRKTADKDAEKDAERRKEIQKKRQQDMDREDVEKNGDATLSLRLGLEYLALTLEAHEAKDISTMVPKLQAYQQSLLASAPKLKGRAGDMLLRPVGGGNVGLVVDALQLSPFLQRENWPLVPGDISEHYDRLILKLAREKKPEELGTLWDTAINLEAGLRKERMFEGEYALWVQNELPQLRWQRAQDLVRFTSNPVTGLAEMLNLIKANPNHPGSPAWVNELRSLVKPVEAGGTPPGAEPVEPKP